MQAISIHGKVHDGNVEPATVLDSTLEDLLAQLEGSTVLVTLTVLQEPCIGCLHDGEHGERNPTHTRQSGTGR